MLYWCVFNHAPEGKEVSERLLSVRQGERCAAEYTLEFRILAAESGCYESTFNNEMACQDDELPFAWTICWKVEDSGLLPAHHMWHCESRHSLGESMELGNACLTMAERDEGAITYASCPESSCHTLRQDFCSFSNDQLRVPQKLYWPCHCNQA